MEEARKRWVASYAGYRWHLSERLAAGLVDAGIASVIGEPEGIGDLARFSGRRGEYAEDTLEEVDDLRAIIRSGDMGLIDFAWQQFARTKVHGS
jgi:hypothetical protein